MGAALRPDEPATADGGSGPVPAAPLSPAHRRRLREMWRSAGWPCRDPIELDLLAGGYLLRHLDPHGRETLHLSDAGLQLLAATRRRNQAAFDAHEALVARVALEMQRAGRVVWRGLSLRAPLPAPLAAVQPVDAAADPAETEMNTVKPGTTWAMAMPDVYSIRHTTVEDYTEPVAHEIKVSRADLLSDLRSARKGAAYLALSSQCWYVLRAGIAQVDDIPPEFGVMFAEGFSASDALVVARPAPRRAMRLPFAVWMALARAHAEPAPEDDGQAHLGLVEDAEPGPPARDAG